MILDFHTYRPRQTTRTPGPLFNSQPQEFWGLWAPNGPSDPVKAYGPTASATGMHHTLDQAPGQMQGRTSTAHAAGLKAFSSPHATPHNANSTGPGAAPLGHFCLPDKSAACYPTPSNARPDPGPNQKQWPHRALGADPSARCPAAAVAAVAGLRLATRPKVGKAYHTSWQSSGR